MPSPLTLGADRDLRPRVRTGRGRKEGQRPPGSLQAPACKNATLSGRAPGAELGPAGGRGGRPGLAGCGGRSEGPWQGRRGAQTSCLGRDRVGMREGSAESEGSKQPRRGPEKASRSRSGKHLVSPSSSSPFGQCPSWGV